MIETARLLLRPMEADDAADFLSIFTDPLVMASFGGARFTREQTEQWVRRNLDHQARYGYGPFTVILRENGLLIGDCGLERMEVSGASETELGYDVRSDYWHQGLATEAASAVRDYAFGTLRLPGRIRLIRPGNAASRRVAEKVGMHLTATITRHGQQYWQYVITRDAAAPPVSSPT